MGQHKIKVMRRNDRGEGPAGRQSSDQRHHAGLSLGIEKRRRLVEYENLGLLGERPGNRDTLPFAVGELRATATDQVVDPGGRNRGGDDLVIALVVLDTPAMMGMTAEGDHLLDPQAWRFESVGEDDCDPLGPITTWHRLEREPADAHGAGEDRLHAGDRAEQRRLTGTMLPTSAATSPRRTVNDTIESATVVVRRSRYPDTHVVGVEQDRRIDRFLISTCADCRRHRAHAWPLRAR